MKKYRKMLLIAVVILLGLGVGTAGIYQYKQAEKARIRQEQQEAKRKAEEEAARAAQEALEKERKAMEEKAGEVIEPLEQVNTDEQVCSDSGAAAETAREVLAAIEVFKEQEKDSSQEVMESSLEMLEEAEETAQRLLNIKTTDDTLGAIYSFTDDSVAMNTNKNNQVFRDVQTLMWQVPQEEYPKKAEQYNKAIDRISQEWHYTNDEWNYETSTLKVEVTPMETDYTKYWVCHVQTFSPAQLCSALSGGTYGNPRTTTSSEVAAHNGVIGVNGSGFSYSTGEPAPGKTMIKGGEIYSDIYSNGNIMCVTSDGGMFTAAAGMTTREMLERSVWDTYCFGPTLVEGGERYQISNQFNQTYRYQRTAVGMVSPGNYYLVVVDGKGAGGSAGMTYEEIQDVFLDLDCEYAYMMDGGGSSTLVFKGNVLNTLTDGGRERPCADILYFIDVGDGGEGDAIVVHEDEAMLRPPSQ